MEVNEAILQRRSIRKFLRIPVKREDIIKLVNLARMAPSGMNLQPLKYAIVNREPMVQEVFAHTRWAGYLQGKGSPGMEERPAAFILVLCDPGIRKDFAELDAGAAIQSMLLGAVSMGLSACWLGSIDRKMILEIAGITGEFELIAAVAVGYGAMNSVAEDARGDDIRYYQDGDGVLRVPKRTLDEILLP